MKPVKRSIRPLLLLMAVLVIIYLLGPAPKAPAYDVLMPSVPTEPAALEQYVAQKEQQQRLRKDNEARIIWADDSLKGKTPYAIVYLHGFSASQEEGDPVHLTLARNFGCNLYLSRLAQHGLDTTEQLLGLTPDDYWQSAKEALAIGRQLGEKVILMATSTGGTQALQLAAVYPADVDALMLLSPNIAINNPNAWLLNNHWGLQLARLVEKSNYVHAKDQRPVYRQYWSSPYRLEAAVALQEMMETTMKPETFAAVKQPLLLMYYYKDEAHQDEVVRVDAMLEMYDRLGTPTAQKQKLTVPEAGDHVIGSYLKSKDYLTVIGGGRSFLKEILKLPQVNGDSVVSSRAAGM